MQWLKVACKKVIYFWKRPIHILLHAPCKRQLHFFLRPFIISKIVFVFAYNTLLLFRNATHVYFMNTLKNISQTNAATSTYIFHIFPILSDLLKRIYEHLNYIHIRWQMCLMSNFTDRILLEMKWKPMEN